MSRREDEEPLFPPWIITSAKILGPLLVFAGIYWLLSKVLNLPARYLLPALLVLAVALAIYLGGRFYKPFFVDKEGRCTARNAEERRRCRHFIPGARLGGGCGRLREDGRCRYVR